MHQLLPLAILGTGEALTDRIVTTAEVAERCGMNTADAIARSGVRTRHWLRAEEDPLDFGVRAARRAIAAANLELGDIDVVLGASGAPLQGIPDGGALVAAGLGAQHISAYSVQATCLSFLFALREAAFLIGSEIARHVLIVSTEGGSRGLNFAQPESALLIGDAAAAVVVGPAIREGQGITASAFTTITRGVAHAEIRGFGTRIGVDRANDSPSDFLFDMNGIGLLREALRTMPPFLETLRAGITDGAPGIDRIIPHQTSHAGIEGMAEIWGHERMEVSLGDVGNTIGASLPLTLHRAEVQPGEQVLLVGTGSGTHYGGIVLQA